MKVFSALLFPGMEEKPDPTQWKHFIYITVMLPDETLEMINGNLPLIQYILNILNSGWCSEKKEVGVRSHICERDFS